MYIRVYVDLCVYVCVLVFREKNSFENRRSVLEALLDKTAKIAKSCALQFFFIWMYIFLLVKTFVNLSQGIYVFKCWGIGVIQETIF